MFLTCIPRVDARSLLRGGVGEVTRISTKNVHHNVVDGHFKPQHEDPNVALKKDDSVDLASGGNLCRTDMSPPSWQIMPVNFS